LTWHGLRQDIEFEDFGYTLKGLFGFVTSMKYNKDQGYEPANYEITAFRQ